LGRTKAAAGPEIAMLHSKRGGLPMSKLTRWTILLSLIVFGALPYFLSLIRK
jgi:hypothetical protein